MGKSTKLTSTLMKTLFHIKHINDDNLFVHYRQDISLAMWAANGDSLFQK